MEEGEAPGEELVRDQNPTVVELRERHRSPEVSRAVSDLSDLSEERPGRVISPDGGVGARLDESVDDPEGPVIQWVHILDPDELELRCGVQLRADHQVGLEHGAGVGERRSRRIGVPGVARPETGGGERGEDGVGRNPSWAGARHHL